MRYLILHFIGSSNLEYKGIGIAILDSLKRLERKINCFSASEQ